MTTKDTATCDRDGRPVADGARCCAACCAQHDANLDWIAELHHELETALTGQARFGEGAGGRTATDETPLPVNLHASDVGHRLRNTLTTWAWVLVDETGAEWPPRTDPVTGPVCGRMADTWCAHSSCRGIYLSRHPTEAPLDEIARFLQQRTGWIAHSEWGPECFDDIGRVAVDLARAIDAPPPMIALGACDTEGCDGQIRAHQEATFAKCPACRTTYDVAKRKDALLARADNRRFGATALARILTALRDRDPEGRLIVRPAKWITNRVQWGKLRAVGTDKLGRPLYRLGDARRLHDQDIQQAILKKTKQSEVAA